MKKKIIITLVAMALALSASYTLAITNGQPDGDAHPYVGMLVFDIGGGPAWRCSGSLIAPTILLTAGHCTDGAVAARVWFETDLTDNPEYPFGGLTSVEGTPYTHPEFCIGCGNGLPGFISYDVGVVVLDEPVIMGEYAALPDPGLVDTLAMKTAMDAVGYGVQEKEGTGISPRSRWTGLRARFYAPNQLVASKHKGSDMFIKLTANSSQDKGGTCFGDSGGPDLLGGTSTIIATHSFVANANCAGITYSNRIDIPDILEWISEFIP